MRRNVYKTKTRTKPKTRKTNTISLTLTGINPKSKRINKSKSRKVKTNKFKTNKFQTNKFKTNKLRGGSVTPFSELTHVFSNIGNSLQSAFSGIMPSGYEPSLPVNPSVSNQFLLPPTTQTLNQIVKTSFA